MLMSSVRSTCVRENATNRDNRQTVAVERKYPVPETPRSEIHAEENPKNGSSVRSRGYDYTNTERRIRNGASRKMTLALAVIR